MAVFFVAQFVWSYYFTCIRKGYTLDMWHFNMAFTVFSYQVMLPFSRSNLNALTIGPYLTRRMQPHVNDAYFISTLGYVGILIGGQLWRVTLGAGLRRSCSWALDLPARASLVLLDSPKLLRLHSLIALTLMWILIAYYFAVSGFGFNVGSLLEHNPVVRPILQLDTFYAIFIGSYCLARFARYKEISMLLLAVGLSFGLLFFGSRSALFGLAMMPLMVYLVGLRRRLRLSWLLLGFSLLLFLVIGLDAARRPNASISLTIGGALLGIFYGNSFSDLRDFSTILSFWDGSFLLGKTYLAGLLAFIPRVLFPFRDRWSLGVVTATMAGFNPTQHAGLRIGLFGEAFLNFGLPAVLLLGLLVGAITRLIDLRVKQSLRDMPRSGMRVYSFWIVGTVIAVAVNTTGASNFYSVMFILLLSIFAAKLWPSLHMLLFAPAISNATRRVR